MPRELTEQQAHAQGAEGAAVALERVAEQLTEALRERRMIGAAGTVGIRVLDLAAARRERDVMAERAAAMELSLAAAEYVARIDLDNPHLR